MCNLKIEMKLCGRHKGLSRGRSKNGVRTERTGLQGGYGQGTAYACVETESRGATGSSATKTLSFGPRHRGAQVRVLTCYPRQSLARNDWPRQPAGLGCRAGARPVRGQSGCFLRNDTRGHPPASCAYVITCICTVRI